MRVLFVHQTLPGQYAALGNHLGTSPGHQVAAIYQRAPFRRPPPPWLKLEAYDFQPATSVKPIPSELAIVNAFRRGRGVFKAAETLRRGGFIPDVIWAHSGWGESIFLKDAFPESKLIIYCEFYYHCHGADAEFDPEYPPEPLNHLKTREINAPVLMALEGADRGISPTAWQRSLFPAVYKPSISVIHEGIDTDAVRSGPPSDEELVTYTSRGLEPYRGFHIFMRAIPEIQRRRPNARIVVLGDDRVLYGAPLPPGETHLGRMLRELDGKIDLTRMEFLPKLPYTEYLDVLRRSSAHVYLTYPFILSWSMLEAMAAGCLVVGSRTPPVEEVIEDGRNGLLVDFFSPQELADRVCYALENRAALQPLRDAARQTIVERYDLKRVCLPAQMKLIEEVTSAV